MCGYDPFKWSDNFSSEEEFYKELAKEQEKENDSQDNSD